MENLAALSAIALKLQRKSPTSTVEWLNAQNAITQLRQKKRYPFSNIVLTRNSMNTIAVAGDGTNRPQQPNSLKEDRLMAVLSFQKPPERVAFSKQTKKKNTIKIDTPDGLYILT